MAHFPTKPQIHAHSLIFALCVGMLAWIIPVQSQEYSVKNKKAIRYYKEGMIQLQKGNKEKAISLFEKAIEKEPTFIEPNLVRGDLHYNNKEYSQAAIYYKKALSINPDFHVGAWYYLASSCLHEEEYTEAKEAYETYVDKFSGYDSTRYKDALFRIRQVDFIENCLANPVKFEPVNMGEQVNSRYFEYLPTLTADEQTLVVTVRRPSDDLTIGNNREEEDFYVCFKQEDGSWSKARPLPPPINSHGNEGAQCISPDGRFMYFTLCNAQGGYGSCDIYVSERTGTQWSKPKNLGPNVNSNFWDSQPSISSDGSTLYFVSNRKGGFGESDIWKSVKNASGQWGKAVNLGETINTKAKEMSPFIHPNNTRLYFASEGHPGMGGLDLFYSDRTDDQWSIPVNLGCPINTPKDEMSLIVSASGKEAMFSSEGLQGFGGSDIYRFELYDEARPTPVTYVKGRVFDQNTNRPIAARFELIDLGSGKIVTAAVADKQTGEFLVCIPLTQSSYAFHAQAKGYLFYSDHFAIENHPTDKPYLKNIPMLPLETGETMVLNNVFFETAMYNLKPESHVELDRLAVLLNENPSLKIEISGHTDNVGEKAFNQNLSFQRAQAVYDYLLSRNVNPARLSVKGYGDSMPVADNETEEGRAKNRRTEFKIIAVK